MKHIFLLATVCVALSADASTPVSGPIVSGHWLLAGSPYMVSANITVDTGLTLVIDPGVEVIFEGQYGISVNGTLKAVGTAAAPINFYEEDTTGLSNLSVGTGGWKGIEFSYLDPGIVDSSALTYCNLYDMKSPNFVVWRSLTFNNCNIYHNRGASIITFANYWSDSTTLYEMDSCNLYDNVLVTNANTITGEHGMFHMSNCQVHGNYEADGIQLYYSKILLNNNLIYDNNQCDTYSSGCTAMYLANCWGVITGNKIYNNTSVYDAALFCTQSGRIDIYNNLICNNKSTGSSYSCGILDGGAGMRISNWNPTTGIPYYVRNNIIANNSATTWAAGLEIYMTTAVVSNNTIINNVAQWGGGIELTCDTSICGANSVTLKNNILYNNINTVYSFDSSNLYILSADHIEYSHNFSQRPFYLDGGLTVSYTLVGDTATNVIAPDPGLISVPATIGSDTSALTANFGLLSTSGCIDKGDTTGAYPYTTDYAGNPRISGSAIDIGAYEFIAGLGAPSGSAAPASAVKVYPNPAVSILFVSVPKPTGSIELQDITAKVVAQKNVTCKLISFDIESLPRGIYFAVWHNGSACKSVQKFIVQ